MKHVKQVVEIAHLVNGDLISLSRLSARRERMGALTAAVCAGAISLGVMAVCAIAIQAFGRAIYAPWFVALWGVTAVAVSMTAVTIVRRRLRRYVLGSRLDADAFAPVDMDLVRRCGPRFDVTIVPGMKGHVEGGRAPLPLEALVADRPRTLTLGENATVELSLGSSTFVVRSRGEAPARGRLEGVSVSRDFFRLFSRVLVGGLQVAVVGSLLCAVPSGRTIGERAAHLVAPRITTPWEAEKWLRIEAQAQALSLHQCFDPLPLACQHPGYIGVGVSLTRQGEVRSNWIARSTYGSECPVDRCVQDMVSTWVFDPLPEAMRVVLPVQVLRTEKPLPTKIAEARGVTGRIDLDRDATVEWGRGR
jgi:hypothetical protein